MTTEEPTDGTKEIPEAVDDDLAGLRRSVDENLGKTPAHRLNRWESRPGRVLRRSEDSDTDAPVYYDTGEPWWRGRWFMLLLIVLALLVAAQAVGLLPWSADEPADDGVPAVVTVATSTTLPLPTTTTTLATTTTAAPTTTLAPVTAPPTEPPTAPPTTVATTTTRLPATTTTTRAATTTTTRAATTTTRPPTTQATTTTTFDIPTTTTVPPEP